MSKCLEFPTIFLLPNHIAPSTLPELESQISTLTYDINEAEIVLGKIYRKQRAVFELRSRGIETTEISILSSQISSPPSKRRKLSTSDSPTSDHDSSAELGNDGNSISEDKSARPSRQPGDIVKVVKLAWFADSISSGRVLPLDEYLTYQGRKETSTTPIKALLVPKSADILRRAQNDLEDAPFSTHHGASQGYNTASGHSRTSTPAKRPALMKETTSEHDIGLVLPPVPEYLKTKYSCQRPTPSSPVNGSFIEELKKVRTIRVLEGDKTGVRAYSTAIATLAAYPHLLTTAVEVERLPGCKLKIAELFREWKSIGHVREVRKAETDPRLSTIRRFYEIWGVGEIKAQEFYNKGWRELDDVVEYGWDDLTRVQKIGCKYYDELLSKIPRAEVELIANTILSYADKRRKGFQMIITGGYRRGKPESGDVDVVLSHPDPAATRYFIEELVTSLEKDDFITHTLTLSTKNSERGEEPVTWKGEGRKAGSGFDTLDKALVVWQDPSWDKSSASRNCNPHRRVDIIVSPWKTVGCAVIGWSGGTTFQRDLRIYCKEEKSLKFDSSGIRSRTDGRWIDLESGPENEPAPDMLTAEKRVFRGLGLEWRPPTERCTG